MDTHLLKNRTALITGGTRGIGKAIAIRFVQAGASVAICGTNAERGKEAAQEISSHATLGQKVIFYLADVGDTSSVGQLVKKINEDLGDIHILVNNAGITRDNLLMKMSEQDWLSVLDTNLKSVFNTCQCVIRPMMKARYGKIINISSVVGLTGNAGQTNYAASKSGMIGFSKSLAKEMGSRGIAVNCIAPGFIETDMTDALSESQREAMLNLIPFKRLGKSQEIADAALFLASPMADYITGQVLTVDGGMVM